MAEQNFADAVKILDKTISDSSEKQSGIIGDSFGLIQEKSLGFLNKTKAFEAVKWALTKRREKKKFIQEQTIIKNAAKVEKKRIIEERKLLLKNLGLSDDEFEFLKEQKAANDKFAENNEMLAKVAKEQLGLGPELEKALLQGQIKSINGSGGLSDVINKSLEDSSELYRENMEQQKVRDAASDKRLKNKPKTAADKEKAQKEESRSQKLMNALKGLGEKGKEKVKNVGGSAWDKLKKMFIGAAILGFVALIAAFMNSKMWKTLKKKFEQFSAFFKETILPFITDVMGPALFGEGGTFDKLLTDIKIYFDELVAGFTKLFKGDLTGVLDIGKAIGKLVVNMVDNLVTTVMKMFGVKFEPGETALDKLIGLVTGWFDSVVAWARNKFGSLATMVFGKETKGQEEKRLGDLAKEEEKERADEILEKKSNLDIAKVNRVKKRKQLELQVQMAADELEDAEMSNDDDSRERFTMNNNSLEKRRLKTAKMLLLKQAERDQKAEIREAKSMMKLTTKNENFNADELKEAETVFQKLQAKQLATKAKRDIIKSKAAARGREVNTSALDVQLESRQKSLDAARQTRDILRQRASGQGGQTVNNGPSVNIDSSQKNQTSFSADSAMPTSAVTSAAINSQIN